MTALRVHAFIEGTSTTLDRIRAACDGPLFFPSLILISPYFDNPKGISARVAYVAASIAAITPESTPHTQGLSP